MAPTDLARLIIDGLNYPLAPNIVVRACPSVDSIGWLRKVDAVAGVGVHDKQTISGVEARGTVVGHTALVGGNQASIGRWFLGGIWNRSAFLIDAKRPVHRPERSGQKILPVRAVENKEVAVARGLHQHLLGFAVELSIDQHWGLDRIPVVRIV